MERLAALRYSKALFDSAVENRDVDGYNDTAAALTEILETDKYFLATLKNPSISRAQKSELVHKALQGRVPVDFLGLIELVLKRGREGYLVDIFRHFAVLYNEYKSISIATVTSPIYLEPQRISEIKAVIASKINKSVEIQPVVDESLIAGLRIEVDGYVVDSSLKTKLADMKKQLLKSQFKMGDRANEPKT